jgi:hypothetical protein
MNKKIYILLFCMIAAGIGPLDARINPYKKISYQIGESLGLDNYPEFKKFVQKFWPPQHIIDEIEKYKETIVTLHEVDRVRFPFGKFGDTYPLFVKSKQIDRIINAYCLRKLIKKHNLTDVVGVPAKYIYNLDGEWLVFAECIDTDGTILYITEEIVERLIPLQEDACYLDLHSANIRVKNGKVFIIDTEDRSFEWNKNACVHRLLYCLEVRQLKTDCDGYVIWYNHRFNSKNIDFRKVRDEFHALHNQLQQMKDEQHD